MYRLKTLLGDTLSSRNFNNQATEASTRVQVVNRMAAMGVPKAVWLQNSCVSGRGKFGYQKFMRQHQVLLSACLARRELIPFLIQ